MSQPVLTYSVDWGTGIIGKLSGKTYIDNNGNTRNCSKVTVTFSYSTDFKKFYATAVKDGRDYGFIDNVLVDIRSTNPTGVKIYERTDRGANTQFSFDITTSHLTAGEGLYRIGLYVQQTDGAWNYEYFFIPVGKDKFQLSSGDILQVPVITD